MIAEQQTLTDFYTWLYSTNEKHDSPEKSRVMMIRRIYACLQPGIIKPYMLNIGSGPQSLEKQMRTARTKRDVDLLSQIKCFSLDISSIDVRKLLARNALNQHHLRASALALPYKSQSIGLVVSNLAIDFIPRSDYDQPYRECKRVLTPGGTALFNFHHPSMIPDDLNSLSDSVTKRYWTYLSQNSILFSSYADIHDCLVTRVGFNGVDIYLETDGKDQWWEVEASL